LEGIEAKVSKIGCFRMIENSENATHDFSPIK
jgi:hypothetical protein